MPAHIAVFSSKSYGTSIACSAMSPAQNGCSRPQSADNDQLCISEVIPQVFRLREESLILAECKGSRSVPGKSFLDHPWNRAITFGSIKQGLP